MNDSIKKRKNIKIGKTLCGLSFGIIVIFALLNSFFTGLFLALPILACGLVFIFAKRNIALYCIWVIFFFVDTYLRYGSGISWRLVFLTRHFLPEFNYNRLLFAWIELIVFVLLTIITIVKEKNYPLSLTKKNKVFYVLGWILFFVLLIPVDYSQSTTLKNIYFIFGDWLRIFLFISLVSVSFRVRAREIEK